MIVSHENAGNESNVDKKRRIGRLGEDLACRYLQERGFQVFTRNYLRKWGEIDIVAGKGIVTHFVEVKSVSCENILHIDPDGYRPEENVHPSKLKRLSRVMQIYISEKSVGKWQFDVLTVYIQEVGKKAKIERLENIVL